MIETASLFLVAFVLVVLALDMLVMNFNRVTLIAALWNGTLALYALLWGLKLYVAQNNNMVLLGWIQRIQDVLWVHQGWMGWLFVLWLTQEEKAFPRRVIPLMGISLLFSVFGFFGGLYDSLYLYSLPTNSRNVMVVPSVGRILAVVYTVIIFVFAGIEALMRYMAVPYAFQQRRIRYLLAGSGVALVMFLAGEEKVAFLSVKALSLLVLGGVVFYVANTFRTLKLREKVIRFVSLALFGFFLMGLPAMLFYIFRRWFMELAAEVFLFVFSGSMALYFVFAVLLLTFLRKLFQNQAIEEERFPLLVRHLGQNKSRDEFYEALALFLKDMIERDVDIVERHGEEFFAVFSTRGLRGKIEVDFSLVKHFESGEGYFDRELVLHQRPFRRDVEAFFRYFDAAKCEAVLSVMREGQVEVLVQFATVGDEEGFSLREIKELRAILRLIEVLYQNVIFFEKAEETQQTERELALASEIQETLFQREIPRVRGLDIAFYQEPAKWLSGDYLWLEVVSSHELGFVVADVSGKGVSAALITMMIHSTVQGYQFGSSTVNALLHRLNTMLSRKKPEHEWRTLSFATLFAGFVDTEIQTLFFSNAGHYPLLVWDREKREFIELSTPGKPVGLFAEATYVTETYRYESDQIFVLYSDGMTECINPAEEEFGIQRLKALIQRYDYLSAGEIQQKILEEIRDFTAGAEIYDDMTLVIIKT
ncbi:MAG: serine/threonine-protein phosphatase [Brevinematales bacterium]|nr:serine/threonine-protein phosphatase [Brevinematales bacterium]